MWQMQASQARRTKALVHMPMVKSALCGLAAWREMLLFLGTELPQIEDCRRTQVASLLDRCPAEQATLQPYTDKVLVLRGVTLLSGGSHSIWRRCVGTYRNPLVSARTVKYHWPGWSTSIQTIAWYLALCRSHASKSFKPRQTFSKERDW